MSRARRKAQVEVSLFPFLSVLASVIGVLTLIIAAMVLSQIGDTPQTLAQEFKTLQQETKKNRLHTQELKRKIEIGEESLNKLTQTKNKLNDIGKKNGTDKDMLNLHKRLKYLNDEKKAIEHKINKTLLDKPNPKPQKGPAPIELRPSGSGTNLKPYFVECTQDSIVLDPGSKKIRIRRGKIIESARFKEFLYPLRSQRDARVIFLIRPNGVSAYSEARIITRKILGKAGKLPLSGYGEIDFSLFE